MTTLIIYDRTGSRLIRETAYDDDSIDEANADRLNAELKYAGSPTIEIVILRSRTRDEMLETHGRYFKTFPELLGS